MNLVPSPKFHSFVAWNICVSLNKLIFDIHKRIYPLLNFSRKYILNFFKIFLGCLLLLFLTPRKLKRELFRERLSWEGREHYIKKNFLITVSLLWQKEMLRLETITKRTITILGDILWFEHGIDKILGPGTLFMPSFWRK